MKKKQQIRDMQHNGEMIQRVFRAMPREYTVGWFARKLNCDRTNIYNIFGRPSIDTELLFRISQVLNHDFFQDISGELKDLAEDSPTTE